MQLQSWQRPAVQPGLGWAGQQPAGRLPAKPLGCRACLELRPEIASTTRQHSGWRMAGRRTGDASRSPDRSTAGAPRQNEDWIISTSASRGFAALHRDDAPRLSSQHVPAFPPESAAHQTVSRHEHIASATGIMRRCRCWTRSALTDAKSGTAMWSSAIEVSITRHTADAAQRGLRGVQHAKRAADPCPDQSISPMQLVMRR